MAICSRDPVPPSCRQCQKCGRLSRTKWSTASSVRSECDQCGITTDYTDVVSRGAWQIVKREADGDWTVKTHRLPADLCPCGARRIDQQMGLEASPEAYIAAMVEVFREVRRVLRPDGTCWVNMGDSYAGSWGNQGRKPERGTQRTINGPMMQVVDDERYPNTGSNTGKCPPGVKPKDLLMMPARLALALQQDGWWLRSDIIWHKPNPMPESVTDRPTSSHEHVFLLTKSATYFYDADAVREEAQYGPRPGTNWARAQHGSLTDKRRPDVVTTSGGDPAAGRNLRNVWTIATAPYSEAHFATFPPELAERCIKAGTSERGCCATCGAPWVRVVERGAPDLAHQRASGGDASGEYHGQSTKDHAAHGVQDASAVKARILAGMVDKTTTGWAPSCTCQANYNCGGLGCGFQPCNCIEIKPCTVLDPFFGAGTVGLVSSRLQRDCVGIELNADYAKMALNRLTKDAGLFADIAAD